MVIATGTNAGGSSSVDLPSRQVAMSSSRKTIESTIVRPLSSTSAHNSSTAARTDDGTGTS